MRRHYMLYVRRHIMLYVTGRCQVMPQKFAILWLKSQVQWTLRDSDEARLAERLTALLERSPVAQPPASPAPTADTARLCPTHGAAMQLNHKDGRSWWS